MNKIYFLSFLAIGLIANSAWAQQVDSRRNIKVTTGAVPKGCQFRGNVSVGQSDIYGPTHKDKESEQLNNLKHQASRLGANIIVLKSHQTRYYAHPEYIISEGKAQRELSAHAMSGKAYSCSYGVLSRIREKNVSDVKPIDE